MKQFLFVLVMIGEVLRAVDPAAHTVLVPYDRSQPLAEQQAERFYLPYAEFERLWEAAKTNRRAPVETEDEVEPMAVVQTALYRARIEDSALLVEARLEVVTRGAWAALPMPWSRNESSESVGSLRVNDQASALVKGGLVFERGGSYLVEWTLRVPTESSWTKLSAAMPPASSGLLHVNAPQKEGWLHVNDRPMSAAEWRLGRRHFTSQLGQHDGISLRRTAGEVTPAEIDAPVLEAEITTRLSWQSKEVGSVQCHVQLDFSGTEREAVEIELEDYFRDSHFTVSSPITGNERGPRVQNAGMRLSENGRLLLRVNFEHPVSHSANFVLKSGLHPLLFQNQTPRFKVAARRARQTVLLIPDATLNLRPQPAGSQRQTATENGLAFEIGPDERLAYELQLLPALSEAKVDYLFQVSAEKSELLAALNLQRTHGQWSRLRIGLPAGYELQSLTGEKLPRWQVEDDALFLLFDPPSTDSEIKFLLHLARTAEQPAASWGMQPLKLEGFEKHSGSLVVAAHVADETRLGALPAGVTEVDPGGLGNPFTVTAPFESKRGLRLEQPDWQVEVNLHRQPARFSVDAVAMVLAADTGLRVSQQIGLNVRQGALKEARVRLPASLPEAVVSGPLLREIRSSVEGDTRIYHCLFQSAVIDQTTLAFDHDLPLTGGVSAPFLAVDEAERISRFFVLDNLSAREERVARREQVETVARQILPWLPEGLSRPQFFRATGEGALEVAYTELAATEGNAALVTLAELTTVLRADGERWDTAVYSLVNRTLQFLPLSLPEGAELISVSVSGEPVRADEEMREGRRVRLIPLIQTQPGQRALEARLVWRFRAPPEGLPRRLRLEDPRLEGLSAERTHWTVWAPPGHTLSGFDGNMREVSTEDRELSLMESRLSEISQVNRDLAANKLGYDDARRAYESANKLVGELVLQQRRVEGNDFKDNRARDLGNKVLEQQMILTENITQVRKEAEVSANRVDADGNTNWVFNNVEPAAAPKSMVLGDDDKRLQEWVGQGAVQLNDNVIVQPVFNSSPKKEGKFESSIDSLSVLSNARGNTLAQSAEGLEKAGGGKLQISPKPGAAGEPQEGSRTAFPPPEIPQQAPATSMPAADPFGDVSRVVRADSIDGLLMPQAATAQAPIVSRLFGSVDEFNPAAAAQLEALRPTGRRSLLVAAPADGVSWHFSKLKDHAVLELTVNRPLTQRQLVQSANLVIGLTAAALAGWWQRRRSRK